MLYFLQYAEQQIHVLKHFQLNRVQLRKEPNQKK